MQRSLGVVGALALAMLLVSGCYNSDASGTGSSARLSLTELAAADTSGTTTSGDTSTGGTGQCRRHHGPPPPPRLDECKTDQATYCASDPFPTPPAKGQPPTADERAQMKALVDCLKANLDQLSSACQDEIDHLPPPPPEGQGNDGQGPPPPPPGEGGGGEPGGGSDGHQGPPPPRGSVDCSKSGLSACDADAAANCLSELPTRAEVASMTADEIHARVEAVVECLVQLETNLTTACQNVVGGGSAATPTPTATPVPTN